MNKIIGYILALLGILSLAVGTMPQLRKALSFIPAEISNKILIIAGVVIVVIGIILLYKKDSGKKLEEVPIYHGKEIVGYRKIKQK